MPVKSTNARVAGYGLLLCGVLVGSPHDVLAQDAEPSRPVTTYSPMTDAERWHQYVVDNFLSAGASLRAIGTAFGDSNAGRPVGWDDRYARNLASEFGRFTIQGTVQATVAKALGYDTRFGSCECTGGWKRTKRALVRSFVTYDHTGKRVVDLPRVTGIYTGSVLMMAWYPSGYRLVRDGLETGTISLAVETGFYVVREFAPDLKHLIFRSSK